MEKDIARKRLRIEKAAIASVNNTLKVVKTYSARELEDLTGYHQSRIQDKSKENKARINGELVSAKLVISHMDRLGVLRLRGTKVIKGSGPVMSTTRSKQGRKKTKGRPGLIIYNILGKTIKRKGIVIKGRGGNILAGSNQTKSGKYKRGDKLKIVKSGKHKGKRYTSGKLTKMTGPSLGDAFDSDLFQDKIDEFIDEKLNEYIVKEFKKKGIFKG